MKTFRVILLLAIFFSLLRPTNSAQASHQFLWWDETGDKTFTAFGANATIEIVTGQIEYLSFCPDGIPDTFFTPAANVYIVPSGSVNVGDDLEDVSEEPNTVVAPSASGLFIAEIIGFTAPAGTVTDGTYAVVYDECQDGTFGEEDKLFDPAFEVLPIPADVPPPPLIQLGLPCLNPDNFGTILCIKSLATIAQKRLEKIHEEYTAVFKALRARDLNRFNQMIYSLGVNQPLFKDPSAATLIQSANAARHYQGLAADPPDPNFQQVTTLTARDVIDPLSDEPLIVTSAKFGMALANEQALVDALIHSLERYQGADSDNNGRWGLVHARAIKHYALLLAEQMAVSNVANVKFQDAIIADSTLDARVAVLQEFVNRIKTEGFNADEIREARNFGLDDTDLAQLRADLSLLDFSNFSQAALSTDLAELRTNNTLRIAEMNLLSNEMDSIIATLEADDVVPDESPIVNAGGPYTVQEGSPITFSGSASGSPAIITLYEWDLDGDGSFDDALGTTPSYTYQTSFTGWVGLRITNSLGRVNVGYAKLTVSNVNVPPSITSFAPLDQNVIVEIGSSGSFNVTGVDPDDDPISVSWYVDNALATTGSTFAYTPAPADLGRHVVEAWMTDSSPLGGTVRQIWYIAALHLDIDSDLWRANADCDDSDPAVNPDQDEIPLNGKDDDCNPETSDFGALPVAFFNPINSGRNVALLEAGATVHSFSSQFTPVQAPQNMLNYTIVDEPWSTGNGLTTNQWVIFLLDDGASYLIDRIQIMPRTDFGTQRVKDFAIDVSTTTTEETAFTTVLTGTAADNGQLQEFLLPTPIFAKYIRYRALNNRGSTCCISTEQLRVITGQEGGPTVTFQNLSSDADNNIVSYLWDFGDGTTATEASPTHTFPGPGNYLVSLTATDSSGQENTFSLNQRVVLPPTASFTNNPLVPNEGQSVTFNDTSSAQEGRTIIQRNWNWGDGSNSVTTTSSSTTHTFADNQVYEVTLQVADSFGLESTITKPITPANVPPNANVGVDRKWISGVPLDFKVTVTDPGSADAPFVCHWDFGDGGSAETCTTSHTYNLPTASTGRSYTATITVTDKDGGVGSDSLTVKVGAACTPGQLGPSSGTAKGDLYYTRYSETPNVKKVTFDYQSSTFTLNTPVTVASVTGADGIVFAPDGDILIGGQGNRLHKIDLETGSFVTVNPLTPAYHLALDPSGTKVWASGIPGSLASVPLNPFGTGTVHTLTGDDTAITSIAFDGCGNAFYTRSGPSGNGNFGVIDLTSFTTTRKITNLPAAHGMAYDSFTGYLLLFGSTHVTQINPANLQIVSDLTISGANFDQGTADGKGHVYVASNSGHVLFVDYAGTGLIGDAGNFKKYVFLDTYLDDVAPLSGPGAPPNRAPILSIILDQTMNIGETLEVQISASDPDNDLLTLSTSVLPAFGSFVDNGNGSGILTFTPMISDTGSYEITTNASDGEESVSIHFTLTVNATTAQLIVIKHVINDNGGTADAGHFTMNVSATNPSLASFAGDESGTSITLDAGSYRVTETGPNGYTESYSADCSGTIANGETKTCIIANDDRAPELHLRKVVVNDNGGTAPATAWTVSADGAGANDLSGTSSVDSGATLKADTLALSEGGGPAGYTASDWVCVGGTQNGSNITLGLGQEATCTITNDDIAPKLHLRKVVVNDNGGTKSVADFTLTADGTGSNDLSGTSPADGGAGLKADTWALSETNLYGYSASAWVCVGGTQSGNNITVGVGGEATCTITNNDQPGTIMIIKNAKPAQGSFAFTTTGTGYNGFTLMGATTNDGNKNTQTLNAGMYRVKESTQLAWILTGIGGSTDPNTPYACTVSGSGGSTGVGDLSTQTAAINLENGDTVTCVFENTGQGATRTQGFWATHSQLAQIAWLGGTAFEHTFPGVAPLAGIGDRAICGRALEGPGTDDISKVMGGFWSDISKTSTGAKRSSLDQVRMQLLQQLLAAELNASAFGSVPSGGAGKFAEWESALCGTNTKAIQTAMREAATFNTQGDSSAFTPGTSADSKYARAVADIPFWDIVKP